MPLCFLLLVACAPDHLDSFQYQKFLLLWSVIQDWVRSTDNDEFNKYWKYIKDTLVLKNVAQYIAQDWLPYKEMWSVMSHQNRTIFEKGDTNILLESYVIT